MAVCTSKWLLQVLAVATQAIDELSLLQLSASRNSGDIDPSEQRLQHHHNKFERPVFFDPMDALDWLHTLGANPSINPARLSSGELNELRNKVSPLLDGKQVLIIGDSRASQFYCYFKAILDPVWQEDCNMESFWNSDYKTEEVDKINITYMNAPTAYGPSVIGGDSCGFRQASVAVADHGGYSAYDVVIYTGGRWDMYQFSEIGSGWGGSCQTTDHHAYEAAIDSELALMAASGSKAVVLGAPGNCGHLMKYMRFASQSMKHAASKHGIPFIETVQRTNTDFARSHTLDGLHFDEVLDKIFIDDILEQLR